MPQVQVIQPIQLQPKRLRVAAYARVSSDSTDQLNSLSVQVDYYTPLIQENPNRDFAGIYTDEGITGTSTKHREQFNRLMDVYLKPGLCCRIRYVLGVANDCFRSFIVGQVTEAVILGALCTAGMLLLRLPYATMTGAVVGFTALIPIMGAYIGTFVGAFMICTVNPIQAVVFVVFLLILQQIEGNLIYPHTVGSSIGLPGIWVLASVTLFGGLFGILGMLVGVPLTATAYRLLKNDLSRRGALGNGSATPATSKEGENR